MTASATRPSRTATARAMPAASISPPGAAASPTSSTRCSASSWAARRGQQARQRGGDLRYNMEITLEEAFARQAGDDPRAGARGTARPATAAAARRAPSRSPARPAAAAARSAHSQGFFTVETHLRRPARAAARSSRSPAAPAAARAAAAKDKTLKVTIPPGVEDGTRIRLAGEGEAGLRGSPGRRSLHLPHRRHPSALPARRRQYLLPRPHHHDHRGARRHHRGARRSTAAARASPSRPAPRPASSSACAARA